MVATAGCSDKIDGIGFLSSPTSRSVNVMHISTPLIGMNEGIVIAIIQHIIYFSWCGTRIESIE
jgi:hypothetical protein